uniref:ubiquitinyl hydrolase 1 n=1 Tax=Mesocestoides corti TaxID=53468 RepID=A0A5K3EZS4_MESCO
MVYRRDREKAPDGNSTSEISSDSTEEDLDNLIDDLLEKLAVCPSRPQRMTIKNRKERSKHERSDRSSAVDVAGTSKDDSRSFGFQRYQYSPEERGQGIVRGRGRQLRSHIPSTGVRPSQFPYPTYVPTENLHTQPLKRRWPRSLETSKKPCDQLSDCLDDVTEAGAGNNSEDEYYNITDTATQNTSKAEDNSLEQLLKEKKGLKVVRVHGDGACLFRSVSHQVYGDEEKHEIVRKQVVDYMYKNREHFSQYVTEDFDHYLHRKRQPTCYGNHLEIQAISELYNRPVEIYYNNVVPINVFHAEYSHDVPIRLRYCGRTHYNSIIDPCKPSFGHGLGMPNYQPGLPEKDLVKQAILESEASELEEAMLRDKLAESETKQLEDCIAEHVLRESLFEHVKAHLDSPVGPHRT